MSDKPDTYAEVTARVLDALDAGVVPWRKPWREGGEHRNLQSGRPYRGANVWLTEIAAMSRGFDKPFWTTYKAARKAGGHVRKGERGTRVVFWKFLRCKPRDGETPTNDDGTVTVPMLRGYTVFNVDQCDGLEVPAREDVEDAPVDPMPVCDRIIAGMPAAPPISHGGDRAFYVPADDRVQLPERDRFTDAPAYYATAFHELAHATGHVSRLDRSGIMETARFGSDDYSREELIAEMTAAYVAQDAGIGTDTLPRSASYIDNWRSVLSDDPRAVVVAAGRAQKAADWILDRREETDDS